MARSATNLSELPPVILRRVGWYIGVSAMFGLLGVGYVVFREPSMWLVAVSLFVGIIPMVMGVPVWLWHTRRIRQALRAANGRLCTHCMYDVSSLESPGTCPECGNPIDFEKDRRSWKHAALLTEMDE